MNWISIHFRPTETQDVFLRRAYLPFLEQWIWPVKGTRAFFVRYADEQGPHLRLRFRGENDWATQTFWPAFNTHFEGRGTWEEQVYTPEADRFGGEAALPWAEEHFHISTRTVLERMQKEPFLYPEMLADALSMHTITIFATGIERVAAARYFKALCSNWIKAFFVPAEGTAPESLETAVLEDFEQLYQGQAAELRDMIHERWMALEEDSKQPASIEWLRWLRGNELIIKELGDSAERALPSLIHLSNNRLGINNQDEVYVLYLLSQTLLPKWAM